MKFRAAIFAGLFLAGTTFGVGTANAAIGENCKDIGNGDVCIRLGDISNGKYNEITVWFTKRAGAPVTLRLGYFPGAKLDEGAFTISAGQVRGYTWYNQPVNPSLACVTGALRTGGAPNWSGVIYGGSVCR